MNFIRISLHFPFLDEKKPFFASKSFTIISEAAKNHLFFCEGFNIPYIVLLMLKNLKKDIKVHNYQLKLSKNACKARIQQKSFYLVDRIPKIHTKGKKIF